MLHGDIKVNDHVIGSWRAVNETVHNGPDAVNTYRVTVAYTNIRNFHQVAKFYVMHRYGDGALILASKILAEAPNHLRAPTLDDDGYAVKALSEKVFL